MIFERLGYDNKAVLSHENYPKKAPIVVPEADSLVGMTSSTEIRRRINGDLGVVGLLTPGVIEIVKAKGLYRE